jgi:hypothetical protein
MQAPATHPVRPSPFELQFLQNYKCVVVTGGRVTWVPEAGWELPAEVIEAELRRVKGLLEAKEDEFKAKENEVKVLENERDQAKWEASVAEVAGRMRAYATIYQEQQGSTHRY